MAIGEILILIFMMFGVSIASMSYVSGAQSLDDVSPYIDDLTAQIRAKNSDTLNSALANALGIPYFVGVTTLDEFIKSFKEKFLGELSNSASGVSVIADGTNTDTKKVSISSKLKNTAKVLSEQYAKAELVAPSIKVQENLGRVKNARDIEFQITTALRASGYISSEISCTFSDELKNYFDTFLQENPNISYVFLFLITSATNPDIFTFFFQLFDCPISGYNNLSIINYTPGAYVALVSPIYAYGSKTSVSHTRTYTPFCETYSRNNNGYFYAPLLNKQTVTSDSLKIVQTQQRLSDGTHGDVKPYVISGINAVNFPDNTGRTFPYVSADGLPMTSNNIIKTSLIIGDYSDVVRQTYIDKKAKEKLRAGIMDVVNVNSKVAVDGSLEDTDEDTVAIVRADALKKWREKAEKEDEDLIGATFPLINTIGVDTATKVGVGNPNISIDQAVDEVTNPELPFIDKTPDLPQATYEVNNGLFTIYQPTVRNMIDLAYFLWSAEPIDTLKKIFTNPIDCIVSLALYPFSPTVGTAKNIFLGMVDTSISAPTIKDIFQTIDMGSIYVAEYYNNFLDYSPYTKVSIYLPFIGICQLNVDDIMGATISVEYRCELISGTCLATVKVKRGILNTVLYQFSGSMGLQVPVSGANFMQVYKSVIETIGATAGAIYSGGASMALLGNAVNNSLSAKPEITRSGGMGGNSGFLGTMQPYIIIERPQTSIPNSFVSTNGIVSNVTATIGSVAGYCKIMSANLNSIDCTQEEKAEIQELLESGIFV